MQLQPRHAGRRERRSGLHERNATRKERHSYKQKVSIYQQQTLGECHKSQPKYTAAYCLRSSTNDFDALKMHAKTASEMDKNAMVSSRVDELSTIESIRKQMKSTTRPYSASPRIPTWILDLDLNLDVSQVDLILPFHDTNSEKWNVNENETYYELPNLTFLATPYDDDEDFPDKAPARKIKINFSATENELNDLHTSRIDQFIERTKSKKETESFKSRDPTSIRQNSWETYSPKRYQGDKKVLSSQQGGIRSTPFQPKATKYINQMLTFKHMQRHDKKLKIAKAVVDTRMPTTFKTALEKRRIVESGVYEAWGRRSYETSTQMNSSSENSVLLDRSRSR